jgi:hypothetical protein
VKTKEPEAYQNRVSHIPAILKKRGRKWYVMICDGPLSIEAELGKHFENEYLKRVVLPRMARRK